MAQVILFGGGDAGGLIITPNGIKPIPPFDPALLLQLRAVATLVRVQEQIGEGEIGQQVGTVVGKFTNLVVNQVTDVVGKIDAENGLIYQDDDGVFTCGSTGKPPIPIPVPRRNANSL